MKDPAARETWMKRVERWKDSGLSTKEFAAEVGINARSLSWWRWHLAKSSEPAPIRRRRRKAKRALAKPSAAPAMTFVEVPAPAPSEAIELIVRASMRVCVRPGFDEATLRRLLDVLEHRS